jgi:hypothetical protein
MMNTLMELGLPGSMALAFAVGAVLSALSVHWLTRRLRDQQQREARKLHRSLNTAQVQLDQARKNVEALQEEVLGWRRRSAMSHNVRNSRSLPPLPTPAADDWIISALLDTDSRPSRIEGFADTQVMAPAAH